MAAKSLMILGTASGVGKSVVAAAFCRIFSDAGYRTAPFKAQNMSNNSFVTDEGGEMGRAQVVQAECARILPHVDMNPILLKPSADDGSQVVIQGKAHGHMKARAYFEGRQSLFQKVQESYTRLAEQYEVLVLEGAGSPVEINLKPYDLVNFRTAEMADAQCLLVADIDRGGVFASLAGTFDLMEAREKERVLGIIVNKFRGDLSLFHEGIEWIEGKTGKKVLGVLPYDRELWVPEEDAVSIERSQSKPSCETVLDIAVIRLPHISNFTDFEPLQFHPGVCLRYVDTPQNLGTPDLIILPGTKATIADYRHLLEKGFSAPLRIYVEAGGKILGICGGFQMLGKQILDPNHTESSEKQCEGFGFLDMTTIFHPVKILDKKQVRIQTKIFGSWIDETVEAYEIHMGHSQWSEAYSPFGTSGCAAAGGRVIGTYYHGLFDQAGFRNAFLQALARSSAKSISKSSESMSSVKQRHYDSLASFLRTHLDLEVVEKKLGLRTAPMLAGYSS